MPQAIPMVVAAAATYGVGGASAILFSGTAFAMTGATFGALVGAAASIGSSLLVKPKAPTSAVNFDAGGGARTFMVRQPTAPFDVVVGRVKKSGVAAFMHSMEDDEGRADGYFYLQIALAAHECELIGDVFIHDELSTVGKFAGLVRFGKNLGADDQAEDADFLAELGEELFFGHRGRGIANLAARLKGRASAFPNGLPNLSAIVWGVNDILDPRTGQRGWTNNAVLVFAWWKTWSQGMKVDWQDIDEDTLIDSANVADVRVRTIGEINCIVDADADTLSIEPYARALDVGDGVRISAPGGTIPAGLAAGTTYYAIPAADGKYQLASSVQNAFARTAIDILDAGTGEIVLHYWDRAQWKCNGTFTLDQDKDTIRTQLLSAFMGFDVEVGGKWFIHAPAATLPTVTLDEDDLAGPMVTRPLRSTRDKFNGVRARYIDPAMNWQPTDAPPWTSAKYLAEDNGVPLWEEVEFPFTIDRAQTQQSMKLHTERNRRQRTVQFTAQFTGVPLKPQQGVYLNFERFGWVQKQHIVTGWTLSIPSFDVALVLQEDDADVYAWSVEDEIEMNTPQDVVLPDPSAIPAPTELTVVTPEIVFESLTVEWEPSPSAFVTEYELEYRTRGDTAWTSVGKFGIDARTHTLARSVATDFRIRAISTTGAQSSWRECLAPGDPTDFLSGGDGELSWTNPAGADFIGIWRDGVFHVELAVVGSSQSQTGLPAGAYQIHAITDQGNVSNPSATVIVAIGGDDE